MNIFRKLFTRKKKTIDVDMRPFIALIEAVGMLVENEKRRLRGESLAYTEEDFTGLIRKYDLRGEETK